MKRKVMDNLINWKNREDRKPLILRGERQVGKTYILKSFGETYYKNVAYFNFDHNGDLKSVFDNTKDPNRLLEQLAIINGASINEEDTLIIFDEIGECPNALNSLKYFYEEKPEYHIACAGSLLGITLGKEGFPVGKVEFLDMYPMTFKEFLLADSKDNLIEYLDSIKDIENIPDIFYNQFLEKLKVYFIIGGMPEVVKSWITYHDMERVNNIQNDILGSYESDFAKHTSLNTAGKISLVWKGIPSQLSRDNKKFLYQTIKEGARAREYEDAINWLNNANNVFKVYNVNKPNLPLCAYNDLSSFKLYLSDVGLLRRMTNLDGGIIASGNRLFEEFKGALTENYVLEQLTTIYDSINYFTFDNYEIDYLIQTKNEIIPIEVKSGTSNNNASLNKYNERFSPKIRVRFSMNNLSLDGNLLNVPLFMVEYLPRLIDIVLNK